MSRPIASELVRKARSLIYQARRPFAPHNQTSWLMPLSVIVVGGGALLLIDMCAIHETHPLKVLPGSRLASPYASLLMLL